MHGDASGASSPDNRPLSQMTPIHANFAALMARHFRSSLPCLLALKSVKALSPMLRRTGPSRFAHAGFMYAGLTPILRRHRRELSISGYRELFGGATRLHMEAGCRDDCASPASPGQPALVNITQLDSIAISHLVISDFA